MVLVLFLMTLVACDLLKAGMCLPVAHSHYDHVDNNKPETSILENENFLKKKHDNHVDHFLSVSQSEELSDDDDSNERHILENSGNNFFEESIKDGNQCKEYLQECLSSKEKSDRKSGLCLMAFANCSHLCDETGDEQACSFKKHAVQQ